MARTKRIEVYFSGHVQGVGFRYTTSTIAARFEVSGYVQNLPDGRVLLVAEGLTGELNGLLSEITSVMAGNIRDCQTHESPAMGDLSGFTIRR